MMVLSYGMVRVYLIQFGLNCERACALMNQTCKIENVELIRVAKYWLDLKIKKRIAYLIVSAMKLYFIQWI